LWDRGGPRRRPAGALIPRTPQQLRVRAAVRTEAEDIAAVGVAGHDRDYDTGAGRAKTRSWCWTKKTPRLLLIAALVSAPRDGD
jgi:hypothetical protein